MSNWSRLAGLIIRTPAGIFEVYECAWCHRSWGTPGGLALHYRSYEHREQVSNPSQQLLDSL